MFTGDASQEEETDLINKNTNVYADVLKIAHHGSKNSTSENFLSKVKPKFAVISVGKNNMYGHPAKELIDRLINRNIKFFRTDKNGCISVFSDGNYLKIRTMNGENINYES